MQVSPSLAVADLLHAFVEKELLPGTGVEPAGFWASLETLLKDFQPRNRALLERRDALQARIDAWWKARKGQPFDLAAQTEFLTGIGYLLPEPAPFTIGTGKR